MSELPWSDIKRDIAVLANTEYPKEACGFIFANTHPETGLPGYPGGVYVTKVVNVDDAPWYRFRISETDAALAARTGRCIGVWHSHPSDPAVPSEVDVERAVDGVYHLIYSVQDEDLGVFVKEGDQLVPRKMVMPE